jgi:hypothetical protein
MGILYPGDITEDLSNLNILNMSPFSSYYGSYNVHSRNVGGFLYGDPIESTKMAMYVGNEFGWQDVPLC